MSSSGADTAREMYPEEIVIQQFLKEKGIDLTWQEKGQLFSEMESKGARGEARIAQRDAHDWMHAAAIVAQSVSTEQLLTDEDKKVRALGVAKYISQEREHMRGTVNEERAELARVKPRRSYPVPNRTILENPEKALQEFKETQAQLLTGSESTSDDDC